MINILKIKLYLLYTILFLITFSAIGFDFPSALSFLFIPFINYRKTIGLIQRSLLFKTIMLFYLCSFISLVINTAELNQAIRFLSTFWVLLFITSNELFNETYFKKYIRIIIAGLLVQNVIAVYLIYVRGIFEIPGFKPLLMTFRYQGFYNLTILAIFMAIMLLYMFTNPKILKSRALYIFTIILMAACMVLSLTRSSWVSFILGTLLIMLIKSNFNPVKVFKYFRVKILYALGIITVIVFASTFMNDEYNVIELLRNRLVNDSFNSSNDAEQDRAGFVYPLTLIGKIGVSPFGIGLGHTEKIGGQTFALVENQDENLGTHNTFAHILLDFGLLPFFLFITFNILMFLNFLRQYKQIKKSYVLGAFVSYLAIFPSAMFQDLIIYLPMALFPILCLSYFLCSENKQLEGNNTNIILQ